MINGVNFKEEENRYKMVFKKTFRNYLALKLGESCRSALPKKNIIQAFL